jgi:predicted outer membrane repeat protein
MPTLPALVSPIPTAANLAGAAFPALTPDLTGTVHVVDATAPVTDAAVQASIQGLMNGGGRITFNTGGPARTLRLTSALTMGNGALPLIIDGGDLITLDGNFATRLIQIADNRTLTVQRLRFVNARAAQNGAAINGDFRINTLTVIDCEFDNCQTLEAGPDRGGGAIRAWNSQHNRISRSTFTRCAASNGGAVNSLGSRLWILECTFNQNAAFGTGGGQDAGPNGQGGIGGAVYVDNVSNAATPHELVVSGCVFNANIANDHAGAVFGYMTQGTASVMTVDACTFAGNVAGLSSGGAIYTLNDALAMTNSTFNANRSVGNSGALRCDNTTSTVTNCTFTGNQAEIGGAIGKFSGNLTLQNVTVANNTSNTFSAGIFSVTGGTVTVNKSIFADNTAVNVFNGWHTNTTFATGGGNIQWPSVGGQPNIAVTMAGTTAGNPLLGALGANGGPTFTRALGGGSAAINSTGGSGSPATDQRGTARDGSPDAGAFEN